MNTATAGVPAVARQFKPNQSIEVPDPLGDDEVTDQVVTTTRRAMTRVALVATEVASRFQREGLPHDPMAWMLSPRALFGGVAAVDACVDRDSCLRGILLHGLSLGLDADPDEIDDLIRDDDPEVGDGYADRSIGLDVRGEVASPQVNVVPFRSTRAAAAPRLFTATVSGAEGGETIQAFHASLATDEAEVAGRLYGRIGAVSADARIVDGFDQSDPLVTALVSAAICDTLELIAAEPGSTLATGLDLNIEQRFIA